MNRGKNVIVVVTVILSSGLTQAFAQLSRPPATAPLQYSPQLVSEIKRVQQAAFESDYAYRQVAHLA
ncbi:MAG TPA: hypothetical protein VK475_03095, partial [Pyrinomonadaceae bacterium]|nr:hypothetical protein [Pyrinomonadaceae bacterium]